MAPATLAQATLITLFAKANAEDWVMHFRDADLDDTTLGFFGGGKKEEKKPARKAPAKEAPPSIWERFSLSNLFDASVTPTSPRDNSKSTGAREVIIDQSRGGLFGGNKAKALPASGGALPPRTVVGVRPPSMFKSPLVRAPLVGLIGFFVGGGVTYALFRPRHGALDYEALLSS